MEDDEDEDDEDYELDDDEDDDEDVVLEDTLPSDEDEPLRMQVAEFSNTAPHFVIKCAFVYCNAINKIVDFVFDTSFKLVRRAFKRY